MSCNAEVNNPGPKAWFLIDLRSSSGVLNLRASTVTPFFTSARCCKGHQTGEKMRRKKAKLQGEMSGASASVPTKTERIERVTLPTSDDQLRHNLLDGIPNDVTLEYIASNLPWRAWQVLSTLSADWQRAFQGRMIYEARVRCQKTQKFFVVLCELCTEAKVYSSQRRTYVTTRLKKRTLSLFSPSEERCFRLPPLPGCHSGLPDYHNYVMLDGAIYNLGGARNDKSRIPSKELQVLDLARHPLEWRQCASMRAQRPFLENIAVVYGKIFVFADSSEEGRRSEVYDPKVDAWSWIAPISPRARMCFVFSIGQQFIVFSGINSNKPANAARNDEEREDSKLTADLHAKTKLVVKDGRRGPKLISVSDDSAEDDMDGLHKIIQSRLTDLRLTDLDSSPSAVQLGLQEEVDGRSSFPDIDLASSIAYVESRGHARGWYLGIYDPVTDKWTAFERERLGTHRVETTLPEITLQLRHGTALVWPITL